jgi:hypothetical protein
MVQPERCKATIAVQAVISAVRYILPQFGHTHKEELEPEAKAIGLKG